MGDFGIYRGDEFLKMELKPRSFIIENMLRDKDTVLLVGDEKAGKSLLVLQMICSLTSMHPFLDKFGVLKQCKVSYLQLEGELGETQDRFKRLMKMMEITPELFQLLFLGPLNFENEQVSKNITHQLKAFSPDIVIIDPLYQAMSGSLSDDCSVRKFIGNVRILKDSLNCSLIIVHHTHKLRRDRDGFAISEDDEATYGSKFLKAYPDHTILFSYDKGSGIRTLTCSTQRSGDIEKSVRLRLVQPDPLYFEEIIEDDLSNRELVFKELIFKNPLGLTADEVVSKLGVKKVTFYRSMKKLLGKFIEKSGSKPVFYKPISQCVSQPLSEMIQINDTLDGK